MPEKTVAEARRDRARRQMYERIDKAMPILFENSDESYTNLSGLRKLLAYYQEMDAPYNACVRENMLSFGPGRTENVCASIKDMIRGTHNWRKGAQVAFSDDDEKPEITEEIAEFLLSIPDDDIERFRMEVANA